MKRCHNKWVKELPDEPNREHGDRFRHGLDVSAHRWMRYLQYLPACDHIRRREVAGAAATFLYKKKQRGSFTEMDW